VSSSELGARHFLLDQSVNARSGHPRLVSVLARAVQRGQLVSCGPFIFEALYSARDADQLAAIHFELVHGMPHVDTNAETFVLAHRTQLELSRVSERSHRRPPIDYLIAATAHQHALGVLHYDRDYDLIAEHSSLEFESRWIADPGSL